MLGLFLFLLINIVIYLLFYNSYINKETNWFLVSFYFLMFFFIVLYMVVIYDNSVIVIYNNNNILNMFIYKYSILYSLYEYNLLYIIFLYCLIFNKYSKLMVMLTLTVLILYILSYNCSFRYLYTMINSYEWSPSLNNSLIGIHPLLIILLYSLILYNLNYIISFTKTSIFNKKKESNTIVILYYLSIISILLGSLWASEIFGWGGWWFWDPIEIISFLFFLIVFYSIHISSESAILYKYLSFLLVFVLLFLRANLSSGLHVFFFFDFFSQIDLIIYFIITGFLFIIYLYIGYSNIFIKNKIVDLFYLYYFLIFIIILLPIIKTFYENFVFNYSIEELNTIHISMLSILIVILLYLKNHNIVSYNIFLLVNIILLLFNYVWYMPYLFLFIILYHSIYKMIVYYNNRINLSHIVSYISMILLVYYYCTQVSISYNLAYKYIYMLDYRILINQVNIINMYNYIYYYINNINLHYINNLLMLIHYDITINKFYMYLLMNNNILYSYLVNINSNLSRYSHISVLNELLFNTHFIEGFILGFFHILFILFTIYLVKIFINHK